jgi:hypothetical protein
MLGRWYRYQNELHLMEVECIEPDLYLNLSEGALQRFTKP